MQKTIKNLMLFAILGLISSINGMNNKTQLNLADFDIKKTEDIRKSTTLYFYKNQKVIGYSEYSETPGNSDAYVNFLNIYERNDRGNGLGKKLALYTVAEIQKGNHNIKSLSWISATLDKDYMSQDGLDKFYKNLGGINTWGFTFNLEKLKNTLFDQEKIKNLKFSDINVKKSSRVYRSVNFYIYPKNTYSAIGSISLSQSYDDFNKSIMSLDIRFCNDSYKKKGLGKQLAVYALNTIMNDYPSVKKITFDRADKNLRLTLKKYGMECDNYGMYCIDIKDVPVIIQKLNGTETIANNSIIKEEVIQEIKHPIIVPNDISNTNTTEKATMALLVQSIVAAEPIKMINLEKNKIWFDDRCDFFIDGDGIVSPIPMLRSRM